MHAKESKQMAGRQVMYAVEFTIKIKDGVIKVPEAHRKRFGDKVKVILLSEEEIQEDDDLIARLLKHPLPVPNFTPLSREDAHARS
jgi:hypothetical protein